MNKSVVAGLMLVVAGIATNARGASVSSGPEDNNNDCTEMRSAGRSFRPGVVGEYRKGNSLCRTGFWFPDGDGVNVVTVTDSDGNTHEENIVLEITGQGTITRGFKSMDLGFGRDFKVISWRCEVTPDCNAYGTLTFSSSGLGRPWNEATRVWREATVKITPDAAPLPPPVVVTSTVTRAVARAGPFTVSKIHTDAQGAGVWWMAVGKTLDITCGSLAKEVTLKQNGTPVALAVEGSNAMVRAVTGDFTIETTTAMSEAEANCSDWAGVIHFRQWRK